MCDDVAVMYAGRIVEYANVRDTFNHPAHPYTLALLRSVPKMDERAERLVAIEGVPATGYTQFPGCPFAPRCPFVLPKCQTERPPLGEIKPGHQAACWRAEEIYAQRAQVTVNGAVGQRPWNEGRQPAPERPGV